MGSEKRRNRRKHLQRTQNRAAQQNQNQTDNKETRGAGYSEFPKSNPKFDKYYQTQGIVPPEEWDKFQEVLKLPLPSTFRITQYRSHAKELLNIIESEYFSKLTNTESQENPEEVHEYFPLPWYPEKLAWQVNISRKEIRRNDACQKLHNFLITETSSGNISRQEAVSMIPPVVLDIQSHHKVLDMCAAPGSKTAQLIEMLHGNDKAVPEGVVIANDVDNKRCYMLVHQTKRLQSPNLIITNHDSGAMPNITLADGKRLKFDRILCDVPCSGDGTLRKNADIWGKWNLGNCLNFHGIQARILRRGLELLEVGGKLVYSTCSMCPLEDESVIHNILSQCGDSVELVDASDRVPGLKYVPGLSHWLVMNKDLEIIPSPEEIPERNKSLIKAHMFPPSTDDAPKYNLNRCIRVLPHFQNSGGFFVALLRKVKLLPWENKGPAEEKVVDELEPNENGESDFSKFKRKNQKNEEAMKKKLKPQGYREDPYVYFNDEEPVWTTIKNVYDLNSSFDHSLLMTRTTTGKKKTIYFTSKIVKEIISFNENKIKIINTGIKLFCRCDKKHAKTTEFRLTQEGLATVYPFMGSRVIKMEKDDVIYLLKENFPSSDKYSESVKTQVELFKDNGSLALSYEEERESGAEKLYFALCGWKGTSTLRAYVTKYERIHYLRLCGVEISESDLKSIDDSKLENEDSTLKEDEKAEGENGKTESVSIDE